MPYLFAVATVITLFLLTTSLAVICFRCRSNISSHIRDRQQPPEEDPSSYSSPIKYCETVFSPRHRSGFDRQVLGSVESRPIDIGKRLSNFNQNGTSLQNDLKRTALTLTFNESNPRMDSLLSISKGPSDYDVNHDGNFLCLTGSTVTTPSESLPTHSFLLDQSATISSRVKDSIAAKDYFRRKKPHIQSSDVLPSDTQMDDLTRPVSSYTDSFLTDTDSLCRKANVFTVTSFGPNETIDTEVW